jgi:hypothetical protein
MKDTIDVEHEEITYTVSGVWEKTIPAYISSWEDSLPPEGGCWKEITDIDPAPCPYEREEIIRRSEEAMRRGGK